MKRLFLEIRLYFSDKLLLWAFKILPNNSDEKTKVAMLLIKRYDGAKYRLSVPDKEIDRKYQENPKIDVHVFRKCVRELLSTGTIEQIQRKPYQQ